MVKVRLQGLPDEVLNLISQLKQAGFSILEQSAPYQNRNSKYIRVYLDMEMD